MPLSRAERVERRRAKLRAAGLRPIQLWIPDTNVPGFAEECRRQCLLIAQADATDGGRRETEFWERVSADAWDDLG
ncbi:MAG TPA: antitoxin MazE family protein [Acetobacteraceae bacterium]|nr:antitoxin MazE family protein [Acetobacteraceae bacterium]